MLFNLVMIAWMAPMVSAGAHCSNPFPGSVMIMHGIDLSTLDMDNLQFKRPVITPTCKQGNMMRLGETMYELPDQVFTWYNQRTGTLTEDTRVIETSADSTNKLNSGVTVKGSYGAMSGSGSGKSKEMQRTLVENKFFNSIIDAKIQIGTMTLKKLTMSESAKDTLSSIKKPFKEAPQPYLDFIEVFGTHYFSIGTFGGVIRTEFKIESFNKKKYSREDLEVQTKIAYNDLVGSASLKVKAGTSTAQATSDFKRNLNITKSYDGGTLNLGKHDSLPEWKSTVVKHPALISGTLSPISDLLEDQPKVQEQLELAVDSYFRGLTTCAPTATSLARKTATVEGIPVLCDTETDGGNWVIIQSRRFGNVNFDRNWDAYEAGFGEITKDHWLGLTNMHTLCNVENPCEIRFDFVYFGRSCTAKQPGGLYFEEYSSFYLGNAEDKFRMHVSGPSGNAGDSLTYHSGSTANGMQFTTPDQDNDAWSGGNCAVLWSEHSGWWWNDCGMVFLNKPWGTYFQSDASSMQWGTLNCGSWGFITSSEIKVRRK